LLSVLEKNWTENSKVHGPLLSVFREKNLDLETQKSTRGHLLSVLEKTRTVETSKVLRPLLSVLEKKTMTRNLKVHDHC
jgi:hypothetical protein